MMDKLNVRRAHVVDFRMDRMYKILSGSLTIKFRQDYWADVNPEKIL